MTRKIKGPSIHGRDDQIPIARQAALRGKLHCAFVDLQRVELRRNWGHHVARAAEQQGARAGFGEVGGGEGTRNSRGAGLEVAHIHDRFGGRAVSPKIERRADRGSGAAIEDETSLGEYQQRSGSTRAYGQRGARAGFQSQQRNSSRPNRSGSGERSHGGCGCRGECTHSSSSVCHKARSSIRGEIGILPGTRKAEEHIGRG